MTVAGRVSGDTLLSHLAWGMPTLSSQREDIAVEALGYILQSNPARQAVEELVTHGCADLGRITRVKTQVVGEGRPDLVGFDPKGRERLLIEAKFWASLTDNQPNTYLERSDKVVMFIAPFPRIEPLWTELTRRAGIERARCSIDDSRLKSVVTDGNKCLMLTSWGQLLDRLEAADRTRLEEVRQLRGLVEREDDERGFPPLRSEEMSPEIPRRVLGLRRLLSTVSDNLKEIHGIADIRGIRGDTDGIGFYIKIAGVEAWVGIHFESWANGRFADTPLWILFFRKGDQQSMPLDRASSALEYLARKDPCECFEDEKRNAAIVPIKLSTGVDYDGVVDSVVQRIRQLSCLIETVCSAEQTF